MKLILDYCYQTIIDIIHIVIISFILSFWKYYRTMLLVFYVGQSHWLALASGMKAKSCNVWVDAIKMQSLIIHAHTPFQKTLKNSVKRAIL